MTSYAREYAMSNYFSLLLTRYRKDNGLTQQEMVVYLCQQTKLLSALDLGTLSRWENGRTTPPMEKRLLVLLTLGMCDEYFYLTAENQPICIDNNPISKLLSNRFDTVNKLLMDFRYGFSTKHVRLKISSYDNAPDEVKAYTCYKNASYAQICHLLDAQIGCWQRDEHVLGFFVHASINDSIFFPLNRHVDDLENKLKLFLNKNLQANAFFVMDQINSLSIGFESSNLRVFLALLSKREYKKFYVCVNVPSFLKLALRLGGEIVGTYSTNEMNAAGMEHSQLVVFDSLKFISNKSVFEFFANVYNKLNRNSPELLKQLRESIK
ncbi:helix-turn-helix transcriptional regulator [Photobacterium damselae]|nr:helix-turn-helix transcriptional regulator [Photobacterium damselae]